MAWCRLANEPFGRRPGPFDAGSISTYVSHQRSGTWRIALHRLILPFTTLRRFLPAVERNLMRKRKSGLRRSGAIVLGLVAGAACWELSGGCALSECAEGQTMLGSGLCCDPANVCGSACCDSSDSCIEAVSLCCGFSSPPCGNQCCNVGESCLGGNSCCPTDRVCVGVCCDVGSGCNVETNTCEACPGADEKFCSESGTCCPTTQVCTPVADLCCLTGELYCFDACRPLNECIR